MKVAIIQGLGELHFLKVSEYLLKKGVRVSHYANLILSIKLAKKINWLTQVLNKSNGLFLTALEFNKLGPELDRVGLPFSALGQYVFSFLYQKHIIKEDIFLKYSWLFYGINIKYKLKEADIAHFRSGSGRGGAIKKARKKGIITISDHSIAHPNYTNDVLKKEYAKIGLLYENNSLFWDSVMKDNEEADYILVNSDFVKDTFVENGVCSDKIKVIYWGVREDFFGLKKEWNLESKVKLIFTGVFGLRKGALLLIELMSLFEKNKINIELLVFGEIENCIKGIILPKNIVIYGIKPQSELNKYLASSDIYVFPTLSEGAARSVQEAMAIGLPVVVSKYSGVPIKSEFDGIIVDDYNVNSYYEIILQLISSNELRESLGSNAITTIKDKFTWDKYSLELVEFYNRALIENNTSIPN